MMPLSEPLPLLDHLTIADEAGTTLLAEDLAAILAPGDVVALIGDLGAGKTALARALIRALADDPGLEVPSPTFTIVQTYDLPRFPVAHFDLYRLADASELDEIGFEDALDAGVALIEWPDRAGDRLPADRLEVHLAQGATPDARIAEIRGRPERWQARIVRTRQVRAFLDANGWAGAHRRHLKDDAGPRVYERVHLDGRSAILMNHRAEADNDLGRQRVAARAAARLAEDTRPFHAFSLALAGHGLSVPRVYAHDAPAGLMLLEDLGSETCLAGDPPAPIADRYIAAVEVLADLHTRPMAATIPDGTGGTWSVPEMTRASLTAEVTIFLDWGVPFFLGRNATEAERAAFLAVWDELIARLVSGERTWCLRDYHSPNLLWLAGRQGPARVGILDYQDTIFGHPSYDVASLAQDARVTVPAALERDLVDAYVAARGARQPGFDAGDFRAAYAIFAAERATRLLGQFARLKNRDSKPGYIRHMPRLWEYLDRTLDGPVTNPLKLWYDAVIPPDRRASKG